MRRIFPIGAAFVLALITSSASTLTASAHAVLPTGSYRVAIGWQFEPASGSNTYVDLLNAIQVFVDQTGPGDTIGAPVSDLNQDCSKPDFQVTVTVGSTTSSAFCPTSVYDPDTARGRQDEYDYPIIPTVPGSYSFHIYGTIHGNPIDQTVTSGPSTFDSVAESSAVDFPIAVPPLSSVSTKVNQVDQRTANAQSAANTATALAVGAILVALLLGTANAVMLFKRAKA